MGELKLYQYPEAIDAILAACEGGELTPEQERELDVLLQQDLPAKAASVISAIRHLEMLEERCVSERERLLRIRAVLGRRVTSLRNYVARCMAALGMDRLETELGTISRVANSRPTIRWAWTDREPPEEFTQTKIERRLDGDKVYKAWKAGTLPDGFEVELGESIRIR
jgi:hypothetical protein